MCWTQPGLCERIFLVQKSADSSPGSWCVLGVRKVSVTHPRHGLCSPPLREGSGGPFQAVGGGSLWGVLSLAELGALVPKALCQAPS